MRRADRVRRDMPREVLVYFVMAMCLYPRVAYEEVFRLVIERLRRIYGDQVRDAQVSKAAISQGRARLGWQVMRELFARQAARRPRAAVGDYAGYRVMSVDGSTLDMPDEQVNAQAFGYAKGGRGEGAYPQIRFVALAECATHALCEVQMGGGCARTANRRSRGSCLRRSRARCWCWPTACSMGMTCGATRWPPERSCCGA